MRATAEIDRNAYVIRVDVSPRETAAMRTIPGARYKKDHWELPVTWAACLQLRGTFGRELVIGPELRRQATDQRAWVQRLLELKNDTSGVLTHDLDPEQYAACRWMVEGRRALLGGERGWGKTPPTVAALDHFGPAAMPALIVAGKTMLWTWAEELEKRWPDARVAVISGTPKHRREQIEKVRNGEADIGIISWSTLRHHSRQEAYGGVKLPESATKDGDLQTVDWQAVVFDEIHRAKDPKAHQTRCAWYLGSKADIVFGLTGTFGSGNPADIWSIMHCIRPDEWPVRSTWVNRYCWVIPGPHGGVDITGYRENMKEELFGFLDPHYLRKVRNRSYTVHPPEVRYLEMGPKERKAYDDMKKNMIVELESGILVAGDPLVKSGRLQQLAAGTPILNEEGGVRALTTPSVKVDGLLEILEEMAGEPLVVFSSSRKLIDLASGVLELKHKPHVLITGGQDEHERYENVQRFQDGEVKLILLTTGAGSEGITLTRANTQLYLDRPWSYIANEQSEGRIDRWGQTKDVFYIDFIVKGTVEEKIHKAGAQKEAIIQEIARDPIRFLKEDA